MAPLRRIVLDVLKPHDPPLVELTELLANVDSVEMVAASLIELDREVQNVELAIEGDAVDFDAVEAAIDRLGGTIHSVDQVVSGTYIAEERTTLLQDR